MREVSNIFVVAVAARQVEGDNFLFNLEAAFRSATAAEAFVAQKGQTQVQTIPTQFGDVEAICQRTIFPLEIQE